MDKALIREKILNRRLTIKPIEQEIEGLEDLTGHLAVRELTASQASRIDKISKGENDEDDDGLSIAATFAFALVERESKELIFNEKDIGQLSQVLGLSVLAPVAKLIKQMSGLDEDAPALLKKSLKKIRENDSATSSTETTAQPGAA
jgi:hypothetical protein